MCLYPKLILNKKYTANKKNNGVVPTPTDERTRYVPVGCGMCIECRNQLKRTWQVRLNEELQINKENQIQFVTLTFSEEALTQLCQELATYESNAIATVATKRFRERWRKKYKKSIRHWLVTELGHENTERIHLHGLLFTEQKEDIEKLWKYGGVYIGNYVNKKTINYIVKYITKIDMDHKNYKSIILTSPGIGSSYLNRTDARKNLYVPRETNETYRLPNGNKVNLPIYYRNKLYSEEEREALWIEKLDKNIRWVCGEKVDVSTEAGEKRYEELRKYYQKKNQMLGYGDDSKQWSKKQYNASIKLLKKAKILQERKKMNPLTTFNEKNLDFLDE